MNNKLLHLILLIGPGTAFAHPGHDHGHWLSDVFHMMPVLVIGVLLPVLGYKLVRTLRAHTTEKN